MFSNNKKSLILWIFRNGREGWNPWLWPPNWGWCSLLSTPAVVIGLLGKYTQGPVYKQDWYRTGYLNRSLLSLEISEIPHRWRKSLPPNGQLPSAKDPRKPILGALPLTVRAARKMGVWGLLHLWAIVSAAAKYQGPSSLRETGCEPFVKAHRAPMSGCLPFPFRGFSAIRLNVPLCNSHFVRSPLIA